MTNFDKLREICPKAKEQFITPKLVYTAKFDDCIVFKFSRAEVLFLFEDGPYRIADNSVYNRMVKAVSGLPKGCKNIQAIIDCKDQIDLLKALKKGLEEVAAIIQKMDENLKDKG